MERSSNSRFIVVALDRASLAAMALGVGLMNQPWWTGGLSAGFFVTLGAVILQIVVGRKAVDMR